MTTLRSIELSCPKYEFAANLAEWQIAGPHRCADPVVDEITAPEHQQWAPNAAW